jgi:hypothetical protein
MKGRCAPDAGCRMKGRYAPDAGCWMKGAGQTLDGNSPKEEILFHGFGILKKSYLCPENRIINLVPHLRGTK